MDRAQEELQFLGFFGIFKQSFKIIFSWKKIFSQITLALILPLTLLFLAHIQFSKLLFFRFLIYYDILFIQVGTPITELISRKWAMYWLFKAAYYTFLLIISLLSTSAVVYTIACIYTAKEIAFKKVMSVVPKVWKRLLVTFLWSFAFVFLYNIVAGAFYLLDVGLIGFTAAGAVIFYVLLILYLVGFIYISVIWHLASVISVLEDVYGIKALIKSKALIKGKMRVAFGIFFLLFIYFKGIEFIFIVFVVSEFGPGSGTRIGIGILCFVLLLKLFLFGFVIQTVIYFVCKSYHHENIDKPALADHLEVIYLGDYAHLNAKNVQLEQVVQV